MYFKRKQIEHIINEIIDLTSSCLIHLKTYVKFVGYEFNDMMLDLKCLLFQNQMDQKMASEEDDFNAMLTFENSIMMKEPYLLEMI